MKRKCLLFLFLVFMATMVFAQEMFEILPGEDGKRLSDYEKNFSSRDVEIYNVGDQLEGDYPNSMVFSPDGSKIFVVNRVSGNVTIFDAETEQVIDNVTVGSNPVSLAVNDDFAVVPCAFSSDVYIIDLTDNSIAAQIAVNGEPVSVVLNQDKAYVGCDTDSYFNDECAIIDLSTLQLENTITNFPVKIISYVMTFFHGRNIYNYSKFTVTDDGAYVVAGDWDDGINFYNTITGEIDYSIATGVVKNVSKSGDGSTIIGFSSNNIYQISTSTYSLTASVNTGAEPMWFPQIGIANQDGNKAFLSMQNNKSAIVDFSTSSLHFFPQTYTPFWVSASPDRSLIYSAQHRFTVLDFEQETILGQLIQLSSFIGAVSPNSNKAVVYSAEKFEGLFFYDLSDLSNIIIYNYESVGSIPEGDAPSRIKITPDGEKALIVNELSHNLTIFDIPNETIDSFIEFDGAARQVRITSDGNWALVITTYLESELVIIDLNSGEIVSEFAIGTDLRNVIINSDDTKAYVREASGGIFVINLDGASSSIEAQIPCGNGTWASYGFGIFSNIKLTPDDAFLFIAYTLGDNVQIMDTATNTIVGEFPAGDSPYSITFSDDGEYAMVLDTAGSIYTIVNVDGANTSVLYSGSSIGLVPIRGNYNSVNNTFEFITFGDAATETGAKLVTVDPPTGAILETIDFNDVGTGNGLQILNDENGNPIVLTSYKIIYGQDSYDLSSKAKYMDYSPQSNVVMAISPVLDELYFLELSGVSNANDIISFTVPEQIGETIIDDVEHTVYLEVPTGTDITSLIPTIEISENATISPASGTPQDFSDSVEYTVTAENGDVQVWIADVDFVASSEDDLIPEVTKLIGNYPNPFNPTTTISFQINNEQNKQAELFIYNLKGQMIKRYEINNLKSGLNEIVWNGLDKNNQIVPSGVYLYKLQAGEFSQIKKMMLMK